MTTALAFDLDGTLTCEELLPVIAEGLSLAQEMATLTRLTLSGAIEFEESFRLRCAILRAVPISRVRAIVAEVALAPAMEGSSAVGRGSASSSPGTSTSGYAGL
jgi:phosphoserine phosphatase